MWISKDNPFQRKQSSGQTYKPRAYDHLVTVESIDAEKHEIHGTNQMGKSAIYKISMDAYNRCGGAGAVQKGGAKFLGHLIDGKMKEAIKPGHKIVLEKAVSVTRNNSIYESTRVINATAQEPNKLFCGLFSGVRKDERMMAVQHWQEKAMLLSDKEALASFCTTLEKNFAEHASGKNVPFVGFQVRALRPNGDEMICFDSTRPYDYLPAKRDEEGNVISKMTPINKTVFVKMIKEYRDYLIASYPDFKETGCSVDVLTFTGFKASDMSAHMALKSEFSSMSKLVSRKSKISHDDEEGYMGRNMAARGILELTPDQRVVNPGDTVTRTIRNIAQKLHVNSYIGDVREMVETADGKRVKLDPSIKVELPKKEAYSEPISHTIEKASQALVFKTEEVNQDEWAMDVDPFQDAPPFEL